jgi:hypothetical protein
MLARGAFADRSGRDRSRLLVRQDIRAPAARLRCGLSYSNVAPIWFHSNRREQVEERKKSQSSSSDWDFDLAANCRTVMQSARGQAAR